MADITKRTAKRLAKHLAPGEHVVVAVLVEAKGALGAGAIGAALLPRTTTRRLERKAGEAHAEQDGLAAGFPGRSSVVVVTDRRILVAPSNGLKFEAPALEINRGGMLLNDRRARGLGQRLQFVFGDGSAVEVDAQRMQPFDRLAEELGTPPVA